MTIEEKKKLCRGCRDNYYNHSGNSTSGQCWMLESAQPVERTKVGTWQNPPYQWHPQTTLSCHHPEGEHWIKIDDVRIVRKSSRAETDHTSVNASDINRDEFTRSTGETIDGILKGDRPLMGSEYDNDIKD